MNRVINLILIVCILASFGFGGCSTGPKPKKQIYKPVAAMSIKPLEPNISIQPTYISNDVQKVAIVESTIKSKKEPVRTIEEKILTTETQVFKISVTPTNLVIEKLTTPLIIKTNSVEENLKTIKPQNFFNITLYYLIMSILCGGAYWWFIKRKKKD